MAALLTFNVQTGFYEEGCGCGGKAKKQHTLLPDTKPIYFKGNGEAIGPVTGIKYRIYPNTTSLNIATADADAWLADGTAVPPIAGWKGFKTRGE